MTAPIDWPSLERSAIAVRRSAHAPYSGYQVGAALLTESGRVFAGCNVENASYGLCICAERSAVAQMVAAGESRPVAIVVATRGPKAGTPCGSCRQTLAEFALDLEIRLVVEGMPAATRTTRLATLLPDAFRADSLAVEPAPAAPVSSAPTRKRTKRR
ncbi:MAG: cytidine deaminase [Polyangiaceae bacterium]